MLLSLILGSSPHLPVSVCGTGTFIQYLQAFLASVLLGISLLLFHYIFRYEFFLFLAFLPLLCPLHLLSISVVQEFLPAVHRIRICCLSLGPDLPWADEPSPGNLRLSMAWILTMLSLLIPAFSLLLRPVVLSIYLLPITECSSTTYISLCKSATSVYSLAPVIFRATPLDQ